MKRKTRKKAVNPEFYIGYADDNESIDDIMQKFSYLDEIQAKNKENDSLTCDQIEDLYRKTANYKPDDVLYDQVNCSSYEDDDAISLHSDENPIQIKRLKRGRPRIERERDPKELAQLQSRYQRVKPHTADPDAPLFIKLPNPIPRSWAQIILPFNDFNTPLRNECKVIKANMSDFDLSSLGSDFQVCYMDPPLVEDNDNPSPGQLSISAFAKYPIPSLVKSGFLFIWAEKQFTAQLLKIVDNWGYRYIENIAWIKKSMDNSIYREPSTFFNKSKTTCYVFRNVTLN
jgi:MT-A70